MRTNVHFATDTTLAVVELDKRRESVALPFSLPSKLQTMINVILDKKHWFMCMLDTRKHIESSLGKPMSLPPSIQECVEESDFSEDAYADLVSVFKLIKGCEYEQVVRENTCNFENDLSDFFVYTVYAPVGSSDWLWQRDCFVTVQIGDSGDPHYVSYETAQVYDMCDNQLAETGFLSDRLSWYARYFPHREFEENSDEAKLLERTNEELDATSSGNPTSRLGELFYADPIWVEKYQGFVARVKGSRFPMVFVPTEPYYG